MVVAAAVVVATTARVEVAVEDTMVLVVEAETDTEILPHLKSLGLPAAARPRN